MSYKFLIAGAGFSGAVTASRLVQQLDCSVTIWDERGHIGGNCYTERDKDTGVMIHKYGPHIFNTNNKAVWDFVNGLVEFGPYVHRVKGVTNGKAYSLPINLNTINQYFNKQFTPDEAKAFVESLGDKSIGEPKNFEEQALKFIGRELYEAFFKGYTTKQWGCDPKELPASILKRIPVRFNEDDNYHNAIYTGIPMNGYTEIFEKLIDHKNITVVLNKKFDDSADTSSYDHVFYTGPVDAYFGHKYGRLGYRTVTFEPNTSDGDHQGTVQVNYCDESVPFTRITEHKHFTPWEHHDKTVWVKEFSKETEESDIPYYPKRLSADKELLLKYRADAEKLLGVSFLGRLATYRYMDMHNVIGEALDFSEKFVEAMKGGVKPAVFPNEE